MTFGFPLGLLALFSLPLIVLIHFFVKKRKKKTVSALFLWMEGRFSREMMGGQKYTLPPLTSSLLLELLAALLLSLLIADLRLEETRKLPHLVVVLDDSASMQARVGEETFRSRAMKKIKEIVKGQAEALRVSLVLTGPVPRTLAVFLPAREALEKLDSWDPIQPHHSPIPGLSLAREIAQKKAKMVYFTDRLPPEKNWDPRVEVYAVGTPLDNLAITSLYVRNSPSGAQASCVVENFGSPSQKVDLQVEMGGKVLFRDSLKLKGNQKKLITLPLSLKLEGATLTLSEDSFPLDNRASILVPPVRILSIYQNLPSPAREHFSKALGIVPFVKWTNNPLKAHLLLLPLSQQKKAPGDGLCLYVGPLGKKASFQGPFISARQEDLMRYTTFEGVIWTAGTEGPFEGVYPLLSTGEVPLIFEKNGRYFLNISFAESNLTMSQDWPIFCYNLAQWQRKKLPGLTVYNARARERIEGRVLLKEDEEEIFLAEKGKKISSLYLADHLDFQAPLRAGLYEIRTEKRVLERFSVNLLDPRESNLSSLETGHRKAQKDPEESQSEIRLFEQRKLHSFLLFLLLFALLADWWILSKYR